MRKIKPDATLMPAFNVDQPRLPIDRKIVQYIRQSTGGQVKENIQSQIQQDAMLGKRLLQYGWKPESIVKIDKDQGVSGQKKQDTREGLNELYHLIKSGQVGAIAAYDASRFWRDRTHVWYNDFIQLLIQYDVCVVMFNQVYFPSRAADMEALREEFKQAAYYLSLIYDKALPAKAQAIELGESYGGHCIPMGYLVAGEKGHRHYVPYEPHAELVRWLFRRYRELGGNLSRLGQECKNTGFSFPAFVDVGKIPHVALRFENGCYPVRTREALISLLSNPAYIGYYLFSKTVEARDENGRVIVKNDKPVKHKETMVVSTQAHEAIVPMDDFLYAYSRLSPINLDGTRNVNKPEVNRRYGMGTKALLEGLVYSGKYKCYALAAHQTYCANGFYNDGWKLTELVVPIQTLDIAVSNAILGILVALKQQEKEGLQNDLLAQIAALQQRKTSEVETLASQLKGLEKSIAGYELDKQSARDTQNKRALDDANRQLNILYAEHDELVQQIKSAGTENDALTETHSLLRDAENMWHTWLFDTRKRFINLVVQHIDITDVTPHLVQITVDLKSPMEGSIVGYLYRQKGTRQAWTDAELETLRQLYPQADRQQILRALPDKTWDAIRTQACILDVTRTTRLNTSGIPQNVTYSDAALCDTMDRPLPWASPVYWVIPNPINQALLRAFHAHELKVSDLIRMQEGRIDTNSAQMLGAGAHQRCRFCYCQ
jgi:hypothetical protein